MSAEQFNKEIQGVFQQIEQATRDRNTGALDWSQGEQEITTLLKSLPELKISESENDGDSLHISIDFDRKIRIRDGRLGNVRVTSSAAIRVADYLRSVVQSCANLER